MKDVNHSSEKAALLSCKTVIRTKDFEASKKFYTQLLALSILEEYNDGNGSRGIIFQIGGDGSNALLEISEINKDHNFFQDAFNESFKNNKAGIQIKTKDVFYWSTFLKNKWETKGPILRPWGSYYLYLKDPDGLHIIMYQEKLK
jgi:catechol 2,3-dioxygenase-like lactoylglutathione lyase family enzyme